MSLPPFKIYNASCNSIITDSIEGLIIDKCSTYTPLNIGETFTSEAVEISAYNNITVSIKTDQDGLLEMQFSPDGENWDQVESYNIYASSAVAYTLQIQRAYFRVYFENTSVSDETYLRLQTLVNTGSPAEIDVDTSTISRAGIVSDLNSTDTPLDDGDEFVGESANVSAYNTVTTSVFSDTSGVLNMEFSIDNIEWDFVTSFTIVANVYAENRLPVTSKYYRTTFENNSGSDQLILRLQTIFGSQQLNEDIDVTVDTSDLARKGIVNDGNSSTTVLNNGITFTGIGVDVSAYASVAVSVFTDQNGTLYFEFSTDNVNWDYIIPYSVTGSVSTNEISATHSRYFRTRFTNNSGVNQTIFRLQTLLGFQVPEDTVIATVDDTTLARAGLYNNVNSTTTPLNSLATFTGTGVDTSPYSSITIGVKTDQDGSLYAEFSPDNTNWDSSTLTAVTASTFAEYRTPVLQRYFRVRFTNTSLSNQTYIRLQTLFGSQQPIQTLDATVEATVDTTTLAKAGILDATNSSSTPLNNGATFTGTGKVASPYASMTVGVYTDQAGILYIDFSTDNSNWDYTTQYAISASTSLQKIVAVQRNYARVRVFNNSGSNQTVLRLQTLFGDQAPDITVDATVDTTTLAKAGVLDTNNSSATPLNTLTTFTGTGTEVLQYSSVTVSVKTDQAGVLYVEFSTDNSNWDYSTSYNVSASTDYENIVAVYKRYFRARFTNSSVGNQSYFRLQTLLGGQQPDINVNATVDTTGLAPSGTVNALNSSTSTLTAGNTFTGTGVDVSAYPSVTVGVITDQNGLMYIEFSPDNTNWDYSSSYSVTATVSLEKKVSVLRRYFRVRFTNSSASTQTYFRLQSILGNQEIDQNVTATVDTSGLARDGTVDANNSTSAALNNGATFTGVSTDVSTYPSVVVACKTDQDGVLYIDFSPDSTNWDSTLTFVVAASTNEVHRITVTRKYFRVRMYNNSGFNQTYLRLQSLLGAQTQLTSTITSTIQNDADTLLTRSILTGLQDGGSYVNVPVTAEGHLEVAIHDPLLPFGSIHTENMTPIFQTDAVYGIDAAQVAYGSSLSGTVSASDSNFIISTGTTIYAQAYIQSEKRLRYRAGQGVISRFTALYTNPANLSYQVAGVGHAEDGAYFGYVNTLFGILYSSRGVRETRTLTVTVGATVGGNATVTLNGTAFSIAVTGASSTLRTAYELSRGTYNGWTAFQVDSTVIFVADSAGPKSGIYSLAAGTSTSTAGTFAQTKAGVAATEVFIPQSDWNGDPMDGTGPSGITADWTKGNVFEIGIQYLGYGDLYFNIEIAPANANNSTWLTVHTIKLPNTRTQTTFRNPTFPFTMAVYSAGSTTNLTMKSGSFAGFIEGQKILNGARFSYYNQLSTVTTAAFWALFTVYNSLYFNGIANQSIINIISVSAALKSNNPCIIYLIKNGTLVGNPNFSYYASSSCSTWDTAATQVTFSSNAQVVWSGHMGDTGEIDHTFDNLIEEFTLQPGEWLTLAAKSIQTNPTWVTGSLNTREDK